MRGHGGEELHGLVHLHLQHVANALAAPGDGQRLGVEARAVAGLAGHLHIGQKAHLDGAHALAFAGRAAAFAGVEAEAPRAVAARLGLQGVGKQLADGVPEADVGGGAGARGLADRGLIDLQHAVHGSRSPDRPAQPTSAGALPASMASRPALVARWPTQAATLASSTSRASVDLPEPRHARDGHQALQRHAQHPRPAGCAGGRRCTVSQCSGAAASHCASAGRLSAARFASAPLAAGIGRHLIDAVCASRICVCASSFRLDSSCTLPRPAPHAAPAAGGAWRAAGSGRFANRRRP